MEGIEWKRKFIRESLEEKKCKRKSRKQRVEEKYTSVDFKNRLFTGMARAAAKHFSPET